MIGSAPNLEQALRAFDRSSHADKLVEAEQLRSEAHARFPIDRWPQMTLDDYALGQEDFPDTFCRWVEFQSLSLGSIKGGSAKKHAIYKRKAKPGWYFPKMFDSEESAWASLRADFVRALELARQGEWAEIDSLEILGYCPALRLKTLHIYFPDEILPVYSSDHIKYFLRLLGRAEGESSRYVGVQANRILLQTLREVPALADFQTKELERFLYSWSDPRGARRVFKIAPGELGRHWDDCRENEYICVGWDAVGDLNSYDSKASFRDRFAEAYPEMNRSTATKKSNELWTLSELEPGDLIVANQGTSKVLAIGEVKEPGYQWSEDRPEYKHTVAVDWDTSYAKTIPVQKRWALVTVAKVSEQLFKEIRTGTAETKTNRSSPAMPVDPLYERMASALERKGQIVLYGPPGTGKTYSARRFSIWWLLRHEANADADLVLGDPDRFSAYEEQLSTSRISKRVWWVVANPKQWAWETLKEQGKVTYRYGRLQRNYAMIQKGDLVIGYQATPDLAIKAIARISGELMPRENAEPRIELEWVSEVPNGLTYKEMRADPVLANSEPMRSRCQGTLFALTESEADHVFSELAERNPGLDLGDDSANSEIGPLTRITFHPSYTYEDFIEGYRPTDQGDAGLSLRLEDGVFKRVCRAAKLHPAKRYLVLIDEINRGNVAKILGELLTLLEKDKRGLSVTLPQSKESFSIPDNVYLLGTMNTADRSVKLLDAALRRRFAFIELMPDLELLRGASIGDLALDDFLEELNRRIALSEGREKQIGHSYLLSNGEPVSEPEDFACRFREEILPLLQEYCYDEYGTLAKFIGKGLVDAEARCLDHDKVSDPEQLIYELAIEFGSQPDNQE